MKTCLITGHMGYIGSRLFSKLKKSGYSVFGIDLKEGRNILHDLDLYSGRDIDCIFHMAAYPEIQFSMLYPSRTLTENVLGTSKVLEFAKNNNVKKIVFSSSAAVYGDSNFPTSPYGLHKLMSEFECKMYSQIYNVDTVCLRYFNVFSKDQKVTKAYSTVVPIWMEKIKTNESLIIFGDGEQTRDFIHVDDVVDSNIFMMERRVPLSGKAYDVGTGISISINQIKELIIKHHSNAKFIHRPERDGDIKNSSANTKPLKLLGWESKTNLQTLERCFIK